MAESMQFIFSYYFFPFSRGVSNSLSIVHIEGHPISSLIELQHPCLLSLNCWWEESPYGCISLKFLEMQVNLIQIRIKWLLWLRYVRMRVHKLFRHIWHYCSHQGKGKPLLEEKKKYELQHCARVGSNVIHPNTGYMFIYKEIQQWNIRPSLPGIALYNLGE